MAKEKLIIALAVKLKDEKIKFHKTIIVLNTSKWKGFLIKLD